MKHVAEIGSGIECGSAFPARGDGSRIDLLGCPFDRVSLTETLDLIVRAIEGPQRLPRRLLIATANVDFVMRARRDSSFREDLWQADLVTADGVPILWAARLLGTPLRGRVNGTDLVWGCAAISAATGCQVALIGAAPGVAARAAKRMIEVYPTACLTAIPTPFPPGKAESESLVEAIRALDAAIVIVALGAPAQERWLSEYLAASGASVGFGCGSSLDIISGDKPRASEWARRHGLEWLHRLLLEPRRLAKRYLIEDSPFFLLLLVELLRRLLGRAGRAGRAGSGRSA